MCNVNLCVTKNSLSELYFGLYPDTTFKTYIIRDLSTTDLFYF